MTVAVRPFVAGTSVAVVAFAVASAFVDTPRVRLALVRQLASALAARAGENSSLAESYND